MGDARVLQDAVGEQRPDRWRSIRARPSERGGIPSSAGRAARASASRAAPTPRRGKAREAAEALDRARPTSIATRPPMALPAMCALGHQRVLMPIAARAAYGAP
jgi:hypothetical protein